ncbi:hypothetical protein HMPREF3169_07800 [Corynebacterium sp. HMSC08C04]|uniref:hypothetical protein n=1 Tax=Corynebacterium sp. HMSC08C04 TaxID=1581137 RepID=UPI0008A15DE2|nr:hypothetical protein [Corynebacterium sp. HMSC08C04]OFT33348.1 hypothetical protein HMPREF3169_07800 [Corynebacterium sp. HMSC08C04]
MTNFDRAAHLIMEAARESELPTETAVNAVEALAKAGLLAEDLPEPSYIFTECGEEHPVWETPDCDVELTPGDMIVTREIQAGHSIENAHLAGLALLAAANYQEKA